MPISPLEIQRFSILCHEGKVKKVKAVSELILFEGEKAWIGGSMINGEPINPLWLKTLGFEYDNFVYSLGRIWLAPTDSGFDVFLNGLSGGITRRIEYIHQLQLIFYAVTGEHLKLPKIK